MVSPWQPAGRLSSQLSVVATSNGVAGLECAVAVAVDVFAPMATPRHRGRARGGESDRSSRTGSCPRRRRRRRPAWDSGRSPAARRSPACSWACPECCPCCSPGTGSPAPAECRAPSSPPRHSAGRPRHASWRTGRCRRCRRSRPARRPPCPTRSRWSGRGRSAMPCSRTGPVSVWDRLLPVLGLILGPPAVGHSGTPSSTSACVQNCGCGLSRLREGMVQPASAGTGPPASTTTVAPVALKRAKSTSATSQLKNGKTSGEFDYTLRVGGEGLVDAAVAEAQVERLVRNADFVGIAETVLVGVEEHACLVMPEPVEHRHIAAGRPTPPPGGHGDIGRRDDAVEEARPRSPAGRFRPARWESRRCCRHCRACVIDAAPAYRRQFVQADPAVRVPGRRCRR